MLFWSTLLTMIMICSTALVAVGLVSLFIASVTGWGMLEEYLGVVLIGLFILFWAVWGWMYYGAITFEPNTLHVIVGL